MAHAGSVRTEPGARPRLAHPVNAKMEKCVGGQNARARTAVIILLLFMSET